VETFPLSSIANIEDAIGESPSSSPYPTGAAPWATARDARREARAHAKGRRRVRALLVFGLDPLVVAGPEGSPASFSRMPGRERGGANDLHSSGSAPRRPSAPARR